MKTGSRQGMPNPPMLPCHTVLLAVKCTHARTQDIRFSNATVCCYKVAQFFFEKHPCNDLAICSLSLRFWSFLGSIKSKVKSRQYERGGLPSSSRSWRDEKRRNRTKSSSGIPHPDAVWALARKDALRVNTKVSTCIFCYFLGEWWVVQTDTTNPAKRCIHRGIQRGVRH